MTSPAGMTVFIIKAGNCFSLKIYYVRQVILFNLEISTIISLILKEMESQRGKVINLSNLYQVSDGATKN